MSILLDIMKYQKQFFPKMLLMLTLENPTLTPFTPQRMNFLFDITNKCYLIEISAQRMVFCKNYFSK